MSKEESLKALFSERLQYLLKNYEMRQNDLAKIVGVSESTVGKWILCKALPRMGVIQKLADYFNVSIKYFLEPESTEIPKKGASFKFSDSEKEMIKKYRQLPPAGKAAVDAVLDSQYEFVKPKLSEKIEIS